MLLFIIGGIQKITLLDYPQKIASIVFTQGCNFCCGYCHNPELLTSENENLYSPEEYLEFLKTRKGKLDGVVITGGEPTIQSGLKNYIKAIKELGFLVKLDTNGTNPQILKELLEENLIDYIAMDIKAPLEKYSVVTRVNTDTKRIEESINIILNSSIDYEFRTTVIKSQLSEQDFEQIGKLIKGAKKYYLQKFVPSKILNENLRTEETYTNEEFTHICEKLKKYVKVTDFR